MNTDAARSRRVRERLQRFYSEQAQPRQVICSWCVPPRVMVEGTLPASHGMCPTCSEREHEKLDAQGVKR
jgi:hypothetical protein